jgi:hypothetical protein
LHEQVSESDIPYFGERDDLVQTVGVELVLREQDPDSGQILQVEDGSLFSPNRPIQALPPPSAGFGGLMATIARWLNSLTGPRKAIIIMTTEASVNIAAKI